MKVCFPITSNQGLDSVVYGHFGSAPAFIIVDAQTKETILLSNSDQDHVHGACNPARAVAGQDIDAIVVGGIGRGALISLQNAGFKVYRAEALTVNENVDALVRGALNEFDATSICGGHSHGHSHSHGGGCCH